MSSLRQTEHECYIAHEAYSDALERGETPPPEALATLRAYSLALGEKREALAAVVRALENEAEYAAAQEAYWEQVKRARKNHVERLKGYVLSIMREHGIEQVKGVTTKFAVVQNPPSVDVDEDMPLPEEFQRVVPATVQPDKVKIREALKAGREVPGARLVPGSFRLVIR